MPTASDTPARPKPETAVGKTPAVPIRSLHDKALKSLARRMAGYTQKEIKTIYEYDPDGWNPDQRLADHQEQRLLFR